MKKQLVISLMFSVILVGCAGPTKNGGPSPAMHEVIDDLGRVVSVPVKLTRVVSTAPSITENVFAVGAGDRLVGVTTFCNYPEEAKAIEKIGDTQTPNMERIVALKPDVVLVSTASQIENFSNALAVNGIVVYVSNPTTLDDVLRGLDRLGELFGTQATVGQLLPELKRRAGAVRDRIKEERRVRVFVQISCEPLFTIGRDSFVNNVIGTAGGESVTADIATAYPKLSKETAASLAPEAIILSESADNQEPNDVFRNSPAVRAGRIYKVNADVLSRPGPRLVESMEQIARMLHPEKFRNN